MCIKRETKNEVQRRRLRNFGCFDSSIIQFFESNPSGIRPIGPRFILQQGNKPKHSARVIKRHLQRQEEEGVQQQMVWTPAETWSQHHGVQSGITRRDTRPWERLTPQKNSGDWTTEKILIWFRFFSAFCSLCRSKMKKKKLLVTLFFESSLASLLSSMEL